MCMYLSRHRQPAGAVACCRTDKMYSWGWGVGIGMGRE